MRARVRHLLNQLCLDRGYSAPTPTFGEGPAGLTIGGAGSIGSSANYTRADHKHPMFPEPEYLLDRMREITWFHYDIIRRNNEFSASGLIFRNVNSNTGNPIGTDEADKFHELGVSGVARNGLITTGFGGFASTATGTGDGLTTWTEHDPNRVILLELSVRFGGSAADDRLQGQIANTCYVGMIHTSTHADFTTIDRGIYFRIPADVPTGPDTWRCFCRNGNGATWKNTNSTIPHTFVSGPNRYRTKFQRFAIAVFPGESPYAEFYINENHVATIDKNLPAISEMVSGYGAFSDVATNPGNEPFRIDFGGVRMVGRRVLT